MAFDFEEPSTFDAALAGIDRVFLVRPPQMGKADQLYPFIDACKEHSVQQMVFLSLLGVQFNPLAPHGPIEKHIKKVAIPHTFLRASFFMQNLSTTNLEAIRRQCIIFVPAGKGKTSFIDTRDIGAVAALSLTEHGHLEKEYDLTGAEALDYYEVAAILSEVIGETITYVDPSGHAFEASLKAQGKPDDYIKVVKGIYLVAKLRMAGRVTDDVQRLLGRPPIDFRQFATGYRNVFAGEPDESSSMTRPNCSTPSGDSGSI